MPDLPGCYSLPRLFVRYGSFLKLYSHYVLSYLDCLGTLDSLLASKKFKQFLKVARTTLFI